MGNPRSGQRPPQQAVRVGQFERAMNQFNFELGMKVQLSIEKYHNLKVVPLERRLARLEVPWHRRLALHVQGWWAALRADTPTEEKR